MSTAVLSIDLMSTRLTKKQRAMLLEKAVGKGWSRAAIARAIGTTRQNLSNIMSRDSENSKYLSALDDWLAENHNRSAVTMREEPAGDLVASAFRRVAGELESLAELLRDIDVPEDYKARRLKSFVDDVRHGIIESGKDN